MNKVCYFHFILKIILSIVLNSMPRNYPDVVNRQVFRSMNHPSNSSTFENLWLEPGIWSLSQFSESWTVYNQFLVSKKAWMLNHCITLLEDILIHKWDRNLSQDSGECGTIRSQNSTEVLTGWTCSAQALSTYTWGLDKSVPAHSSTQFLASILESHCKTPPEIYELERKRKQWVLEWKKKKKECRWPHNCLHLFAFFHPWHTPISHLLIEPLNYTQQKDQWPPCS